MGRLYLHRVMSEDSLAPGIFVQETDAVLSLGQAASKHERLSNAEPSKRFWIEAKDNNIPFDPTALNAFLKSKLVNTMTLPATTDDRKYRIEWYYKNNPDQINSNAGTLTESEAVAWVEGLNKRFPDIRHYIAFSDVLPEILEYKDVEVRISLNSETAWSFQALTDGFEYIHNDRYSLKNEAVEAAKRMVDCAARG